MPERIDNEIIHFTECMAGGIIRVLEQLVSAQTKSGIPTTLIYLSRRNSPPLAEIRLLFPDSQVILVGKTGISGFLKLFFALARSMREGTALVHLHSTWAGFLGRICASIFRKSNVFYSPHGYAFIRTDISRLVRETYRSVEMVLAKTSRGTTIAYGENEYGLTRKLGAKRIKLARHYFGTIDLNSQVDVQRQMDSVRILTVGRVTAAKRPDRFGKLAEELHQKYECVWIGDGESDSFQLNPKYVRVTGWISHSQVLQEMKRNNVFLLLSDWEGLPFAALEAMACGTPVVLWNFPGASDLVVDGESGFICTNMDELLQKTLLLLNDEELRNKFSRNGLLLINKTYSEYEFNRNWRNLYA